MIHTNQSPKKDNANVWDVIMLRGADVSVWSVHRVYDVAAAGPTTVVVGADARTSERFSGVRRL
jgi:hypothetical protein